MVPQVRTLTDLAREPVREVGEQAFVEEDGEIYTSVGTPIAEVQDLLRWSGRGIWVPGHALRSIQQRHREFPDPVAAMAWLLVHPDSVNIEHRTPGLVRFHVNAEPMRQAGLLTSRSAKQVDLLVELRQAHGEILLRAYHLSPTKREPEGRQIWP